MLVGRDEDRLARAAAACDPERTRMVIADASQPDEIAGFVATAVRELGGVDVLFANAGIEGKLAPVAQIDLADFDETLPTAVSQ